VLDLAAVLLSVFMIHLIQQTFRTIEDVISHA